MLDVKNIHTYYGDSYILQGVSLSVPKGKVVALMGRNGVGKTTTIRSIIGFTPPRQGSILFKGMDITRLPAHENARMGIGLVPQGRRIFPSLTVLEHLTTFNITKKAREEWNAERVFSLFPPLKNRIKNKGCDLSGGEQQMLAIGRALVMNPDLMLMDEPTEGLAPIFVEGIGKFLVQEKERLPILLVEQNLSFALEVADYVYIMSKGAIVFQGRPEELANSRSIQSSYLGV